MAFQMENRAIEIAPFTWMFIWKILIDSIFKCGDFDIFSKGPSLSPS